MTNVDVKSDQRRLEIFNFVFAVIHDPYFPKTSAKTVILSLKHIPQSRSVYSQVKTRLSRKLLGNRDHK